MENGDLLYGIASEEGVEVVPPTFELCDEQFYEGYCGVGIAGDRWGVIDTSGHWVIHPKYNYIGLCHDSLFVAYHGGRRDDDYVLEGGHFGYVDAAGDNTSAFQFDYTSQFADGIADVGWYVGAEDRNYDLFMGYIAVDGRVIWREEP